MSSDAKPAILVLVGEGGRFELRAGERYQVGYGPKSDIRLNHATIGGKHATIRCEDGSVLVRDLGTTGGSFVDGERFAETTIHAGQRLRFGEIELAVEAGVEAVVPANPAKRRANPAFAELMAHELRRTPWFTMSAVIHAAVILLLYQFMHQHVGSPRKNVQLSMADGDEKIDMLDYSAPPDAEVIEETEVLELVSDPFEQGEDEGGAEALQELSEFGPKTLESGKIWMQQVKPKATRGTGLLGNESVQAGGFGETVSHIRRRGLDVMFVFDSTSTMGEMIHSTKRRIANMAQVMHALVPTARIGAVTYRDRGPDEEYLTRHVALSRDIYHVVNFMRVVEARGGDDRPEAVLDGLREAIEQSWSPSAQRVIVLVGDAPAHAYDDPKIARLARSFAGNGRSFVHAIVVSPYGGGVIPEDTRSSFTRITKAGNGECIGFERESAIVQQVLSLAFGREYRANLDAASDLIDQAHSRVPLQVREIVRRADRSEIEAELRMRPVSDSLVVALSQSEDKQVAYHLIDLLELHDFPESGRQAAVHALARILGGQLERAVDQLLLSANREGQTPRREPWELGPVSSRKGRYLRRLIEEL